MYRSLPLEGEQHELHGTEIAAVAGPVLATLLNITSLVILFVKTIRHSGTGDSVLGWLHPQHCA